MLIKFNQLSVFYINKKNEKNKKYILINNILINNPPMEDWTHNRHFTVTLFKMIFLEHVINPV